jgi:hypothetical protein
MDARTYIQQGFAGIAALSAQLLMLLAKSKIDRNFAEYRPKIDTIYKPGI